MLDDGAGDGIAQPLALQLVALDDAPEGGGEHFLVADARIGAVRAREWNAQAANDGDPPDCGADEHRASRMITSERCETVARMPRGIFGSYFPATS